MTNQDLLAIAAEYGSPVYVYDAEKIEAQYKRLTSALSSIKKLRIHSMKIFISFLVPMVTLK